MEQKRGDGTHRFKKGGQAGSTGGSALKGGLEPPYKLWLINVIFSGTLWKDKYEVYLK